MDRVRADDGFAAFVATRRRMLLRSAWLLTRDWHLVALGADARGDTKRVMLLAQDADRRVRRYLDVPHDPLPAASAVIVDGFDARWLVVIGPDGLRAASLVDGPTTLPVELDHGWGALRLDAEPSADARVSTSDGEVPITARGGKPI